MARCGWCGQTGLKNTPGLPLPEHNIPGRTNSKCRGQKTYNTRIA